MIKIGLSKNQEYFNIYLYCFKFTVVDHDNCADLENFVVQILEFSWCTSTSQNPFWSCLHREDKYIEIDKRT